MSPDYQATYDTLCSHQRETQLLAAVDSLLNWDERTGLPPAAGEFRAEQITYLAGMIHQRHTDPRLGDWLAELAESPLAADPHSDTGTTIRQLGHEYEKQKRLPQSLVEELARTAVLGQQVWDQSRRDNDFSTFLPLLTRTFQLKLQQAEAYGFEQTPYDALLDDYEQHATAAEVAGALEGLREPLVPLVRAIAESSQGTSIEILKRHFPAEHQRQLARQAAEAIGFDFQRGRLDVTTHPFCAGLGPDDTRITTRYEENWLPGALFGTLHEAGHGIYDQGLRRQLWRLPPGADVSLGIHESQSRMWENMVGRSRAFWQFLYPTAQGLFPQQLGEVPLEEFYRAINDVRPSLIRVEADEATYNLHIIIRFELEQALLTGDLPPADLPTAWNEKYEEYLGIIPPDDAEGCLQDVHWSAGLVGYFPTYSLGNLYAAQIFAAARSQLGELEAQFAAGDFTPLREWLNRHIHEPGQCYPAAELCRRVTGRPLSAQPLIDYLGEKYGEIYGL